MPILLAQWFRLRGQVHEQEKTLPLLFLVFQDDLLELTVGGVSQQVVQQIEEDIISDKLGIELTSKPEANRLFPTTF